MDTKRVTAVIDCNCGNEALYVDGVLRFLNDNIWACDIVSVANGEPIMIEQLECEFEEEYWEWPEKLEDVPLLDSWKA